MSCIADPDDGDDVFIKLTPPRGCEIPPGAHNIHRLMRRESEWNPLGIFSFWREFPIEILTTAWACL